MKKKIERERGITFYGKNTQKNGREWQIYSKMLGIRKVKIKEEKFS